MVFVILFQSPHFFEASMRRPRENKYRNRPITIDGVRFASRAEARRYGELILLQRIGDITDLEVQPRYPLVVNGHKIATYVADFRYLKAGQTVVEDVKSPATRTAVYKLKAKLMLALHGVIISEIL